MGESLDDGPGALAERLSGEAPEERRPGIRTLVPLVYGELREIAGRLVGQRSDASIQPTMVVNDAFLKLAASASAAWTDQRHFLALAARVMRQVLADHAKESRREKRGGGWRRVSLTHAGEEAREDSIAERAIDAEALDAALATMEEIEPRYARVVEMRFYAGMSSAEVAEVLGVSPRTVELDWRAARAWLRERLGN